ncbi:cytochrome C assembly family protein [Polaromonas naphthalenivorans]|uniref:Cytochrome c assembly protein n=1 Tax=Polaromonas naphthalenivorans (strain CJ2) TaxID=365044 RepID=A1VSP9_POLNA|nr:cytochrome c biogenesis protein CcsA [Polaromonas naphthalenivorans]ABM38677.1 cytochrome c assembly protein [Polaromonas naphthalenivorans CJ2]
MILAFSDGWGLAAAAGAATAYAVLALATPRLGEGALRGLLLAAWGLHAVTLVEALLGTPPRFGFAPALSMTVWLVLTVYAVERRLFPQLQAHWALAGLGSAAVILAMIFPGTSYHVIASPWLPLHWALGIASYGLFAAAVVHGWLMVRAERSIRQAGQNHAGVPLLTLERLTFRFVEAGFVLLSATLLVGWLFAETLYGPGLGWKWDHKTIFSLLAWAAFAGLLIGRARMGWRGLKAVRVLYLGAALLLLSYAGSRFVLEVILRRA